MTNKKIALITGITGQDGSYLAEFLTLPLSVCKYSLEILRDKYHIKTISNL